MAEDKEWQDGLAVMDEVYGPGFSAMMKGMDESPAVGETVRHLFREIWTRPALSMRDKRLLVVGATTMLGRADLLAIQLTGAIANGEFTDEQLEDMPLLMTFYAGAGNTTALQSGIRQARERAKEMKKGG